MARKLLDLAKDKIETLFIKIEDNFAELYQDKTQKDQEIQSLATGVNNAKSIYGLTDPLVTTAASYIGQQYTNTLTGDQFVCVNITSEDDQKTYIWLPSNSAVIQNIRDALTDKVDWSKFSNPNLLDNWYLIDPIAQLGITSEDDNTWGFHYVLDRWWMFSKGTWSITPSGLKLENIGEYPAGYWSLGQPLECFGSKDRFCPPDKLTYSVLIDDQIYTATFVPSLASEGTIKKIYLNSDESLQVFYRWTGTTTNFPTVELAVYGGFQLPCNIKAVKLEVGSKQTLAHQDASGRWVLNDPPPNKSLELAKCQRYLRVLNSGGYANYQFGMGFVAGPDQIRIPYSNPITMRANPTVSYSGDFLVYKTTDTSTSLALPVTSLNAVAINEESMLLRAYLDSDITLGTIYLLRSGFPNAGKIILDANL